MEHSSGSIYFTDPFFGITKETSELGFFGVFRVDPDGRLTLLVSDPETPNGLAFSPDESILYVNDTFRRHIRAFNVQSDGSLTNDRVFITMTGDADGLPDGMKVDVQGNVYCTGPGGIWAIDPSGDHIGTIGFPETPANLAFGGQDNQTIYVTARTSLYSVRTNVPGIRTY